VTRRGVKTVRFACDIIIEWVDLDFLNLQYSVAMVEAGLLQTSQHELHVRIPEICIFVKLCCVLAAGTFCIAEFDEGIAPFTPSSNSATLQ